MKDDVRSAMARPSMVTFKRCAEKMAFMHAMYWLEASSHACSTRMRGLLLPEPTRCDRARDNMHSALLSAADKQPVCLRSAELALLASAENDQSDILMLTHPDSQ